MRDTDYERFVTCFGKLAVALREETDPAQQRIYFEALKGLPIENIEAAAAKLATGSDWFPKTSEWVSLAQVSVADGFKKQLYAARLEPWHAECDDCNDTGFQIYRCEGGSACGRTREHYAHTYAVSCHCRPTNRTYARDRAARGLL